MKYVLCALVLAVSGCASQAELSRIDAKYNAIEARCLASGQGAYICDKSLGRNTEKWAAEHPVQAWFSSLMGPGGTNATFVTIAPLILHCSHVWRHTSALNREVVYGR